MADRKVIKVREVQVAVVTVKRTGCFCSRGRQAAGIRFPDYLSGMQIRLPRPLARGTSPPAS